MAVHNKQSTYGYKWRNWQDSKWGIEPIEIPKKKKKRKKNPTPKKEFNKRLQEMVKRLEEINGQ